MEREALEEKCKALEEKVSELTTQIEKLKEFVYIEYNDGKVLHVITMGRKTMRRELMFALEPEMRDYFAREYYHKAVIRAKEQITEKEVKKRVEKRFQEKVAKELVSTIEEQIPDFYHLFIPRYEKGLVKVFEAYREALGFGDIIQIGGSMAWSGCDAFIMKDGEEVRVEFEKSSKWFNLHKHDPEKVDLVICWWKDKEVPVPVLELAREIPKLLES